MNKKKIKQKTSDTALFTALRRTIANKEYKNENLGQTIWQKYFYQLTTGFS